MDSTKAPLVAHLKELRRRLVFSLLFFIVAFGACFYFSEDIFRFLVIPLQKVFGDQVKISYFAPQESFFAYVSLSAYGALGVSFPFIATQIWAFIAPGLYRHERRAFLPFLFATPVMFAAGAGLAYFLIMPAALGFFSHFQSITETGAQIVQETRMSDYISFAMTFILAFGICFQMPILLVLLGRIGVLNAEDLRKGRRYAILIISVVAAVATPPDMISMVGLIVPLLVLYEISILLVSNRNKQINT